MYIPDWFKSEIVLVSPENIRDELIPHYKNLIELMLKHDVKPILVVQLDNYALSEYNLKTIVPKKEVSDIWIRDWMPLSYYDKAIKKFSYHKYTYKPSYNENNFDDHYTGNDLTKRVLLKESKKFKSISYKKIILDGGNFCTNGEIVIVSNKVIQDNPTITKYPSNWIFVEPEPFDVTGHVDGLIRFVNKNTLLIQTYKKDDYKRGWEYCQSLRQEIERHSYIRQNVKTIQITSCVRSWKETEGVNSAYGNYMNFIRKDNTLFVPQYGHKNCDEQAILHISESDHTLKVVPVDKEICTPISHLGGILHCISWNKFI